MTAMTSSTQTLVMIDEILISTRVGKGSFHERGKEVLEDRTMKTIIAVKINSMTLNTTAVGHRRRMCG